MTKTELNTEILELLLEDNESMPVHRINKYSNEILEELKFCKITQKSVNEISLHEFKRCDKNYKGVYENYFVLLVTIIYNGDFEHTFTIYGGK